MLQHTGLYGWALFALLPTLAGGVASWWADPLTGWRAAGIGALAVFLASLTFLVLGVEGLICIAMAAVLGAPLGALGGWLVYRAGRSDAARNGTVAMLLLLMPGSLGWDFLAQPGVYVVRTTITIAAPPERVWPNVVSSPDLPEPTEWFFHTGLAYPTRARIEGNGPGAVRYCEFSTGPLVEPITIWDEPRLLRFQVTENPAPMREWSPYGRVEPRHLHGYFASKEGQFRLTRIDGNKTLLEGTSWYQHGLWPAQYWRLWSDAIIHRIHLRVLNHIRELSEATG